MMPSNSSISTDGSCVFDLPSAEVVPMVALVIGAASPLGSRITASLAVHGARLSLLGDRGDKQALEQVGRLATCLGSPSCDIHELDMEVAGRAAADTLAGPAGAQGPAAQQQGKQHIKTDAEEDMNTQSAILLPEPGSVIDGATTQAVCFKGYAWCSGGLPITRVDVSADEGATWELADIADTHTDPLSGKAWSWVKWQVPIKVPDALRSRGGKWRVCCKAFNINGDTQPSPIAATWNFRGLANNTWHFVDLAVKGP